mmetsp:Transcript_37617/g.78797  ORF Transcript_37617/g.78797 Transcript_37617/m.78797 type:complete len:214 (-) Transcript_37617:429-1070(-)
MGKVAYAGGLEGKLADGILASFFFGFDFRFSFVVIIFMICAGVLTGGSVCVSLLRGGRFLQRLNKSPTSPFLFLVIRFMLRFGPPANVSSVIGCRRDIRFPIAESIIRSCMDPEESMCNDFFSISSPPCLSDEGAIVGPSSSSPAAAPASRCIMKASRASFTPSSAALVSAIVAAGSFSPAGLGSSLTLTSQRPRLLLLVGGESDFSPSRGGG